jgi:hypothetical protein
VQRCEIAATQCQFLFSNIAGSACLRDARRPRQNRTHCKPV